MVTCQLQHNWQDSTFIQRAHKVATNPPEAVIEQQSSDLCYSQTLSVWLLNFLGNKCSITPAVMDVIQPTLQ